MHTGYKVIDAMTRKPYTASPTDTVRRIAVMMRDKGIGSVLLKDGEELVGIVTEWDLVRRGMAQSLDADKTPASKVMTAAEELATADPGMDVFKALNMMRERDIRHLPVIDEGKLVGFITLKDILKLQPQLFELIAEKYDIRESDRKPISKQPGSAGNCELCHNYSEKLKEVRSVTVCPDCVQNVEE